jgi:hypothetical protein
MKKKRTGSSKDGSKQESKLSGKDRNSGVTARTKHAVFSTQTDLRRFRRRPHRTRTADPEIQKDQEKVMRPQRNPARPFRRTRPSRAVIGDPGHRSHAHRPARPGARRSQVDGPPRRHRQRPARLHDAPRGQDLRPGGRLRRPLSGPPAPIARAWSSSRRCEAAADAPPSLPLSLAIGHRRLRPAGAAR